MTSEGFAEYLKAKYNLRCDPRFVAFGKIETSSREPNPTPRKLALKQKKAGDSIRRNTGRAQALSEFLPEAAQKLEGEIKIDIYGSGADLKKLKVRCTHVRATNVQFYEPMPRLEILRLYRSYDFALVSLKNDTALNLAIPSKIYDVIESRCSILAGVNGHCRQFLSGLGHPVLFFEPCSADSFCKLHQKCSGIKAGAH